METASNLENKGIPLRLYLRKISGGRVKVTASVPIGGSWLSHENIVREWTENRRVEVFFQFVEDSEEFKAKKKVK